MPGPKGSVPPFAAASCVRYSIVLGESRRSGGGIELGCAEGGRSDAGEGVPRVNEYTGEGPPRLAASRALRCETSLAAEEGP